MSVNWRGTDNCNVFDSVEMDVIAFLNSARISWIVKVDTFPGRKIHVRE